MTIIKLGHGGIWRRLQRRLFLVRLHDSKKQWTWCTALLCGLVLAPMSVGAAELSLATDYATAARSRWVTAGWLSWHFRNADKRNAANLGIGLEINANPQWTVAGGVYDNSFYDTSVYLGAIRQFWVKDSWRFGLMLGAVNGYRHLNDGGLYPFAFPMLQYQGQTVGANLAVVPPLDKSMGGLLAVQFKVRF